MGKVRVKKIGKNVAVFMGIMIAALGFLWIADHFVDLHPDAYGDLIKSIIFGYGVYFLFVGGYHLLRQIGVKYKGFKKMQKKETPLEAICTAFLVITVINSIMMINGMDTPKEGTFAYVHMLSRLLIISGIISVCMFKQVWIGLTAMPRSLPPLSLPCSQSESVGGR